jgi:hypothetical protein
MPRHPRNIATAAAFVALVATAHGGAPTPPPPPPPPPVPRDLPEESAARRQVEARDAEINARRRKEGVDMSETTKLYTRLVKTFMEYVAKPAGATLDGVVMPADKLVTNGTVTTAVVNAFISDYVLKVKKKAGKGAGTDRTSYRQSQSKPTRTPSSTSGGTSLRGSLIGLRQTHRESKRTHPRARH